jgi:hypothetical protein
VRRIVVGLVAVVVLACVLAYMAPASGLADGEAAPIYGVKIPPGYRDWKLISVAHEEGNLNDIRAQLGNDIAMKAYREGKLPFPDGTIIVALHWELRPIGGKQQSLWPRAIFRGRVPQEYAGYGQGLEKVRRDGRLGIR